jgi:hypothetical protein
MRLVSTKGRDGEERCDKMRMDGANWGLRYQTLNRDIPDAHIIHTYFGGIPLS